MPSFQWKLNNLFLEFLDNDCPFCDVNYKRCNEDEEEFAEKLFDFLKEETEGAFDFKSVYVDLGPGADNEIIAIAYVDPQTQQCHCEILNCYNY